MKILWLGPYREKINQLLHTFSDKIIHHEEKIETEELIKIDADFVISYGYRFIISREAVQYYEKRIINLHISLLPWNRGADPNLWSFLENTPKGVTIHYIDEGIDTGAIISQREIAFSECETLASSYEKLNNEIESLFGEVWPNIRMGKNDSFVQSGKGSYHKSSDKEKYKHLLIDGWKTMVKNIIGAAK